LRAKTIYENIRFEKPYSEEDFRSDLLYPEKKNVNNMIDLITVIENKTIPIRAFSQNDIDKIAKKTWIRLMPDLINFLDIYDRKISEYIIQDVIKAASKSNSNVLDLFSDLYNIGVEIPQEIIDTAFFTKENLKQYPELAKALSSSVKKNLPTEVERSEWYKNHPNGSEEKLRKAFKVYENIKFHKSQSKEDFKDSLFNKPLPFEKVRPGDIAIDYNDEEYEVIDKIDRKTADPYDFAQFFKDHSTSGWSGNDSELKDSDEFIAVESDIDYGYGTTEIYTYGDGGAIAYRHVPE